MYICTITPRLNPFLVNISCKFAMLNFLPCKAKEGIFEVICTYGGAIKVVLAKKNRKNDLKNMNFYELLWTFKTQILIICRMIIYIFEMIWNIVGYCNNDIR